MGQEGAADVGVARSEAVLGVNPMTAENVILLTDSYKVSHYKQYPPGSELVYSYFESRGGQFPEVVFFGLQYYLKRYLAGAIVTRERIEEADELLALHFGKKVLNRAGWEHILRKHGGRLPVVIRSAPEGSVIPNRNVLMTIENTDPECYWLTNYLETLLVQVWYGCTVATQSRAMKKLILRYLIETGDPELIGFKLHDFGYRGVSSVETAAVGGAAHLVNFQGTDTLAGIEMLRQFYGAEMPGFSIPAAEHSTITSWGKEQEVDAYANMLSAYPDGLVAVVSDSYDIFRACGEIWGGVLKDKVLSRNGTLVIRPDSGDPPTVVCQVLEILGKRFGFMSNDKGYRVLPSQVRIIQGDGIDFEMLTLIMSRMKEQKWSVDNIAFGSGGGLLQKLNRDTLKFAFKCASIRVKGEDRDVYKDPVTDHGKISKAGRMKLVKRDGGYFTLTNRAEVGKSDSGFAEAKDELVEVFRDGVVSREWTIEEIRVRALLSARDCN
jgi:nicotinamide phosphoribosyltransferase